MLFNAIVHLELMFYTIESIESILWFFSLKMYEIYLVNFRRFLLIPI